MPEVGKVGKRGAVVIPAGMRRRHNLDEGALFLVEEREEGVLFRPATAVPTDEYRRQFFARLDEAIAATQQTDGLDLNEVWRDDDVLLEAPRGRL